MSRLASQLSPLAFSGGHVLPFRLMPNFTQDLGYTHERMYRTVAGIIVGDEFFREALDSVVTR